MERFTVHLGKRLFRLLIWACVRLVIPTLVLVFSAWGLMRLGLPYWLSMVAGVVLGWFVSYHGWACLVELHIYEWYEEPIKAKGVLVLPASLAGLYLIPVMCLFGVDYVLPGWPELRRVLVGVAVAIIVWYLLYVWFGAKAKESEPEEEGEKEEGDWILAPEEFEKRMDELYREEENEDDD